MTESTTRPGEPAGSAKQRRSGRLTLAVAIRLIGTTEEGRVFSVETHTVVVSLHGAGIVSRYKLMAEQELILRAMELDREAEVRVVGEIAKEGDVYTYGVAFVDGGEDCGAVFIGSEGRPGDFCEGAHCVGDRGVGHAGVRGRVFAVKGIEGGLKDEWSTAPGEFAIERGILLLCG